MQGLGLFTLEEPQWDDEGQLLTTDLSSYRVPIASDCPRLFNVSFAEDMRWKSRQGPTGSRGVGEPPLFLASSVFFAIRDALVSAATAKSQPPNIVLDSPATLERIKAACPPLHHYYMQAEDTGK
jgi:xanthine dehydrogenase molybdopterin-binding subunit B